MSVIGIPAPRCYACDAKAVGVVEHWIDGKGWIEAACKRHADPTIKAAFLCIYCDGHVRKGSLDVDGYSAHRKCHNAARAY